MFGRSKLPRTGRTTIQSEGDRDFQKLKQELEATRAFLQATIEEQEAAKEELKSAHEELLSANEELQSTNEELETAKEELQAANEELITTNDELRIEERVSESAGGEHWNFQSRRETFFSITIELNPDYGPSFTQAFKQAVILAGGEPSSH